MAHRRAVGQGPLAQPDHALRRGAPRPRVRLDALEVGAVAFPTEAPESDGTLAWDHTVAVVVRARAGGIAGLGVTYASEASAAVVQGTLAPAVVGGDAMDVGAAAIAMAQAVRNLGRRGVCASAIAAVDLALWDLKARLLDVSLADLLGVVRDRVPIYGSGGFTSLSIDALCRQLVGWVDRGVGLVKMKVGREPARDVERVAAARAAIGPDVVLMVDANGAYERKQALAMAEAFAAHGVTYFEEPVSSDDVAGLRLVRDRAPAQIAIAAGEYGYDPADLRVLLEAGAVDILQADATRCLGASGFLAVDALCAAHHVPLSAHTAPAIHLPVAAACRTLVHLESFFDHERLERWLFDDTPALADGALVVDRAAAGNGLSLSPEGRRRLGW